jgi:hypothetical protein
MQILLNCGSCASPPTLPAIPADPCCETPPRYSQIGRIIIAPCNVPDPFELEDGAAVLVAGVIDNTNTDGTKAKALVGKGEKPDHEATIYEGAFRRQSISSRAFTINFTFSVGTVALYQFARALQCNYTRMRFWFEDIGGWLYGPVAADGTLGQGGLVPTMVDVQLAAGGGRDDLKEAVLTIMFDGNADPDIYASPFALNCGCPPIESEGEGGGGGGGG